MKRSGCLWRSICPGLLGVALVLSGMGDKAEAAPLAYITRANTETVMVINTATNGIRTTVPVGSASMGVAIHPTGRRVYVTNYDTHTVSVINTSTNTVTATVTVGENPVGVAVNPTGTRVYVANARSNTVSVLDTETNTVLTAVPVGSLPWGVAVHPAGTRVYVTNSGTNTVSVIDTVTNTVTGTATVNLYPQGVALHPAGTWLYVANNGWDSLSVVETATNILRGTAWVGDGPTGVAVNPDGTRVYVTNRFAHSVSVVNTANNQVTATIPLPAGSAPYGIAVHPNGDSIYVANNGTSTVSVISAATNTVTATMSMEGNPRAFGQFIGPDPRHHVAAFRPSAATFYLDYSGNGDWDGCDAGQPDRCFQFGHYGDLSLVGDWSGNGVSKIGIFRPSDAVFYLDYNGNGRWDSCATDRCLYMGKPGDIPLVGDWNGTGFAKVGTYRPVSRTFYLDYDGDGRWNGCDNGQPDRCLQIGESDDIPLVGDWNGSGTSKVGTYRPSAQTFYLDYDGDGVWSGCGVERCLQIGESDDIPLVGDWNGSGTSKVGTYRPSARTFYLDYDGDGVWSVCGVERCLQIGESDDIPLVGDWNGSGTSKVGTYRPSAGTFYLDYDGDGEWKGCEFGQPDRCVEIGTPEDTPLVGKW